jgi:predicted phosphohydrolase
MTIQYASDLHLEFPNNKAFLKENPLEAKGDILLLAGDIMPFHQLDKHKDFFKYLSDHFKTTYWIPGNHEYYYFDIAKKSGVLNEAIKKNVHLVNNIALHIEDIRFIFSTMWSKIDVNNNWLIENSMNDFKVIKNNGYKLSIKDYNQLHKDSMLFLKETFKTITGKSIVMTHHVPTFMHYPEKYKTSILNSAFAVELFETIEKSAINYWIYGHHHQNTRDFKIGNTKMLTNQLGYVDHGEHLGFNKEKIIIL